MIMRDGFILEEDANRFSTLVELLRIRSQGLTSDSGYIFLEDGESSEQRMSFAQLDERARALGARLQQEMKPGDRALLLYPSSLDYIVAFFGCLYAGIVAVPAYPPDPTRLNRTLPRLQAIIEDAQLTVVLTTAQIAQMAPFLFASNPTLANLAIIATDTVDVALAESWKDPQLGGDALAFLQYTSGSTGNPKGVVLSHDNLLYNSKLICESYGLSTVDVMMHWLPLYHDMGLIGGLLQPLFLGGNVVLMSPIDFLKRPFRWLQAISRYKVAYSGAPNFAYDLAVRRTSLEERATLDLSAWKVACNGAEPVRRETLERFEDFFAPAGFRSTTSVPSYGMAECTLLVSSKTVGTNPVVLSVDRQALLDNQIKLITEPGADLTDLVGCGTPLGDYQTVIVDPVSYRRVADDHVGEIWLQGSSVSRGYWNRDDINEETFNAFIAETGEGPFFRTGDLGFLHDGELFITGRHKDLLILNGTNHYPQDIERTVEDVNPALRSGCGAAFSIDLNGEERLVVVHEIDQREAIDLVQLASQVMAAIGAEHNVAPASIVLISARSIDKTSSGKIQRRATRLAFLGERLDVMYRLDAGVALASVDESLDFLTSDSAESDLTASNVRPEKSARAGVVHPERKSARAREIEAWLRVRLGEELGLDQKTLDLRVPFASLGMGSVEAVSLVGDLERWLNVSIAATALYDYPTIGALARFLAGDENPGTDGDLSVRRDVSAGEAIALVGIGCRFPGMNVSAKSGAEAFWDMLVEGRDGIVDMPKERWDVDRYYDPELSGFDSMNVRRGAFLDGIDQFDASFFGISKREAAAMDPQQRLILETSWQALEDAGIRPNSLAGSRTGVFIGLSSHDFSLMHTAIPPRAGTGSAGSIAANRLSYLLDLRGPSMVVDTACSSSLVALDLAVQSLRLGRSTTALVGGVNVMLVPEMTIAFSQAGMMAPDGRCKTFDAAADGYVRGEGCGVVVLKRLSDAQRDGDRIVAVIRGVAVNQDGQSNGMTAPNGLSQQAVVREALADAGVAASDIGYVEAHGTGTELGDAIEVTSLSAVLNEGRPSDRKCYLASVKTNIGHLEAAAGIAGLIKTALVLSKGYIPPHLNVEELNPKCEFERSSLVVPLSGTEFLPYQTQGNRLSRFAGVSSFGFGGTNAHAILEQAPPASSQIVRGLERELHVVTLSAQTTKSLARQMASVSQWLADSPDATLDDIAYSLNGGREDFSERVAILAESKESFAETLKNVSDTLATGSSVVSSELVSFGSKSTQETDGFGLTFLCTGQGSQYLQMGRRLFETQTVFRQALERCADIIDPHLDAPLLSVMYPDDEQDARIHQTEFAQPALFALEYAMAMLWREAGIRPDAVIGHSVGEFVAAHLAGVFDLETGLRLIAERGRLMQSVDEPGSMAVIFAPEEDVIQHLAAHKNRVVLAAVNGPNQVVISGYRDAVADVVGVLDEDGVMSQVLQVSHAFHSPLMQPIVQEFERFAGQFEYFDPEITWISNLTGKAVETAAEVGADYWARHILEPVRFSDGVTSLWEQGARRFVEIGPAPTLINIAKRCVPKRSEDGSPVVFLASIDADADNWSSLLKAAAKLYCDGATVDWRGLNGGVGGMLLSVPTYSFERTRHWPKTADMKSFGG